MAENIFPQGISDDLVLNYSDRKQLAQTGINCQTILNRFQQAELSFYFLLQVPSKQLIFSYAQLLEQKPTYPSPFLNGLEATPLSQHYLASPEELSRYYLQDPAQFIEQTKPNLTSQQFLSSLETRLAIAKNRIAQIKDEYNGEVDLSLEPDKFTFSASQLTQIGQCPFKWFTSRLLKLKEPTEPTSTLENNIRGSLFHKCLELCLEQIKTPADLAKFNQKQLIQAFKKSRTRVRNQ